MWRDASGRLTCNLPNVAAADYVATCEALAAAFSLSPVSKLVIGPDQMFWDFAQGQKVIGLDWDIWMGFTIVALSPAAEPLLEAIAAQLGLH